MVAEPFPAKGCGDLDPDWAPVLRGEREQALRASPLLDPRQAEGRVDAKICREHALQCAVMALATDRPRHKQLFTRLFQAWTNLAIDLERRERPGSPPAF
jgi:hypothetical protein